MNVDELPEEWSAYRKALAVARLNFERIPEVFGGRLDQLKDLDFVDLAISLHPAIQTHMPEEGRIFHTVPEELAYRLAGAAHRSWDAYRLTLELCARAIYNGHPLPESFRVFSFAVMNGTIKKPKGKGAPPSEHFALRWVLYEMAVFVADAFDITLTRNDATSETSACDAVVEAAASVGYNLKYTTIRDWCTHRDYAGFRRRSASLTDFLKEEYLVGLGILRPESRTGLFFN
jgi:hypothetical protein